jgi:hypothetical protein
VPPIWPSKDLLQMASSRITPFRTGMDGIAWDYMGVNGTGRVKLAHHWETLVKSASIAPSLDAMLALCGVKAVKCKAFWGGEAPLSA